MERELTIRKDLALFFGDRDDGVIGLPGLTHEGHVIEASYFFGRDKPKNIIVVSSQVGCPMQCTFCELGSERFVRNLTAEEMGDQAALTLEQAAAHGFDPRRTPHKVTVANCGEPLLNRDLVDGLMKLAEAVPGLAPSFKVSTVLPRAKLARRVLEELADFAARYSRPVQLQISLISTQEAPRCRARKARVAGFREIREVAEMWGRKNPNGRKVNLTLLLTNSMPCDAAEAARFFPPDLFRFRLRPYVPTRHGDFCRIWPMSAERMNQVKDDFAAHGYEVGDWATPSPVERKFGLVGTAIRRIYLDLVGGRRTPP